MKKIIKKLIKHEKVKLIMKKKKPIRISIGLILVLVVMEVLIFGFFWRDIILIDIDNYVSPYNKEEFIRSKVWISKDITNCKEEWQEWVQEKNKNLYKEPWLENEDYNNNLMSLAVEEYYQNKGIKIHDVRQQRPVSAENCAPCACLLERRMHIFVSKGNMDYFLKRNYNQQIVYKSERVTSVDDFIGVYKFLEEEKVVLIKGKADASLTAGRCSISGENGKIVLYDPKGCNLRKYVGEQVVVKGKFFREIKNDELELRLENIEFVPDLEKTFALDELVNSSSPDGSYVKVRVKFKECKEAEDNLAYEGPGSGCYANGDKEVLHIGGMHLKDSLEYYQNKNILVSGNVRYCGGKRSPYYICALDNLLILESD